MNVWQRVQAGVELLNERFGHGWWWRVDPRTLDMNHDELCVLGQLGHVHSFEYMVKDLVGGPSIDLVACGMLALDTACGEHHFEYLQLTASWKAQITALRAQHPVVS